MALNKNALIRYKAIDSCLCNRYRRWTLDDLQQACSDALYEFEGIRKGVSLRTVQLDIQMMRSDRLGYNAPIVAVDKKYYTYEDPKYSISNIPLTSRDLGTLGEVVSILQQFKGFEHFKEVDDMIGRLEHKIFRHKHRHSPLVFFEKNDHLRGLEHLQPLYGAIVQRQVLNITYQSFKATAPSTFAFHPQVLKEHRNRWFVLGFRDDGTDVLNLALDRIHAFQALPRTEYRPGNLDAAYFDDLIGVSKNANTKPISVRFWVDKEQSPYVVSKPLHPSQLVIEQQPDGMVFQLEIIWNLELEREFLGFGEHLKVLEPLDLAHSLYERIGKSRAQYEPFFMSDK